VAGHPGHPLIRRERLTHGEVLIHKDAQDRWLVTWVPDKDNAMDYPGFTVTEASADFPELFGSAADADALLSWAREQPWAMRNIGPWSPAVQVDARPRVLIESDELNLALLGIVLSIALSLALAVGGWIGTASGPRWGAVAGVVSFATVLAGLIRLIRWRPAHYRLTSWARKLTLRP
jgi:hypothetical protein